MGIKPTQYEAVEKVFFRSFERANGWFIHWKFPKKYVKIIEQLKNCDKVIKD